MSAQVRIRRTMDVSQVVAASRRAAGLTQAELASRARVSTRWLSMFENGKTPGAEISKVLGVLATLGVDLVATVDLDPQD
jgi:transcriptional regulator with XRE-family HTH domain